ncbi:MAG: ABC transporter permease, partial [Alphaproteobacteria bacterium]
MAEGAAAPRLGLLRRSWPLLPALAFLGVFFLYPVVDFLALSFTTTKGDFTLAAYNRVLEGAGYMRVMGITFKISLMVTFFSIVLGYPVAYLLAAVDQKTRARLVVFVLIPFWTSFLVRTFALMILLAHEGPLQSAIRAVGLGDAGFKPIFSMTGVMIGTTQALMPMAILVMMSAMLGIDRDLLKAASTMGARRGQAFFRIYLPLSLPGVTAAALLTFITSLGFFITPALLGSPRESMIAQFILTQIQELLNWRLAGALSLVLLACALGIFAVDDRVA